MITWADDVRRTIYAALAAADDEATRLAATMPLQQAVDAARDRLTALACAAQDAGYLVGSQPVFRMRADVRTLEGALEVARRLDKLAGTDMREACPDELADARNAVVTLLSVHAREELEPVYELAQVAIEGEQ